MSLLFMEGWDGYGGTAAHAAKWTNVGGLGTSTPTPRTGSYRIGNTTVSSERAIFPATATIIIGFAFYWGGANQGNCQLWADAAFSVATQTGLELGTDGKVRVRRGNATGGTLLEATASAVLVSSSWNFIEYKTLVDNSGTWTVKVNGTQVLNGSGDTQNNAASTIGGIGFSAGSGNGIDDIYVLDSDGSYLNNFIGDCKVELITVQTGNGTNTGLTTSTGSDHGALVDESPANDDTDYNFGSSAGVKDTYNFTNVSTTGTVYAVQTSIRAKKTDSATKELAVVARDNSTDSDGATQTVAGTTYSQYQQKWEKRPSDNASWTASDVNAAEFGMKVVS